MLSSDPSHPSCPPIKKGEINHRSPLTFVLLSSAQVETLELSLRMPFANVLMSHRRVLLAARALNLCAWRSAYAHTGLRARAVLLIANCRYIDFKLTVLKVDISTFSYSTTFTIPVQYFSGMGAIV